MWKKNNSSSKIGEISKENLNIHLIRGTETVFMVILTFF